MNIYPEIFSIIRYKSEQEFFDNFSIKDLNIICTGGQNLLHESITAKNKKSISEYLIKEKINVNKQDDSGMTPLHYCSIYKDFSVAELILKHGGDLSISDNYGNQPLWTATFNCKGRYYDMVKLFIAYGADAYHVNNAGRSPLDFAKIRRDQLLIDILMKTNLNSSK